MPRIEVFQTRWERYRRHGSSWMILFSLISILTSELCASTADAFQILASTAARRTATSSSLPSLSAIGIIPQRRYCITTTRLAAKISTDDEKEEDDVVKLGSKEYYSGFLSRDSIDEPEERVTGDAVLIPTLKFAAIFSVSIGVLVLAFLISNNLI